MRLLLHFFSLCTREGITQFLIDVVACVVLGGILLQLLLFFFLHFLQLHFFIDFFVVSLHLFFFCCLTSIGATLHQFLFGTFGANNIGSIGDETTSDQTSLAAGTNKAIVMPMTILERNETSTTDTQNEVESNIVYRNFESVFWGLLGRFQLTGYGFGTRCTTFSEQFTETFGTIGFLITTSEALTSQRNVAVGASEALTMPGFILVGYTTRSDDLKINQT